MIVGPYSLTVGAYPDTDASLDTERIDGVIMAVGVRITLDGGSSVDLAIATKGVSSLTVPILTLANATADAWYQPRAAVHGVADGSAIAGQYAPLTVDDVIDIAVSGGGAGDVVEVWFLLL
jgi:hypothetical protein